MRARELKAARGRLGLTQQELADALDIHRVSVARYESGEEPITRVIALAVAWLEYQAARTRKTA